MSIDARPTVVCAWCTSILERGSDDISHGICLPCARTLMARLGESEPQVARRLSMATT